MSICDFAFHVYILACRPYRISLKIQWMPQITQVSCCILVYVCNAHADSLASSSAASTSVEFIAAAPTEFFMAEKCKAKAETEFVMPDICECKHSMQFKTVSVYKTISSEVSMLQSSAVNPLSRTPTHPTKLPWLSHLLFQNLVSSHYLPPSEFSGDLSFMLCPPFCQHLLENHLGQGAHCT